MRNPMQPNYLPQATPVRLNALLHLMKTPRPSRSRQQDEVLEWIETNVAAAPVLPTGSRSQIIRDGYGNLFVVTDPKASSLFTAHVDTVHRPGTVDIQTLRLDTRTGRVSVAEGDCLGADDATGIWVLLNLIHAGVPGTYAFFKDEEIGGKGSMWAARQPQNPVNFTRFKRCISLDRKGYHSLVTHQGGQRCCSQAFAEALIQQVPLTLKADSTGTFTDSANFTDIIPECTNLSVGYFNQHTQQEEQDIYFASCLVMALLQVDWESLPTERQPQLEADDWLFADDAMELLAEEVEADPFTAAQLLIQCFGSAEAALMVLTSQNTEEI